MKAAEWGNPPNRGNQITRAWQVISTISPPKLPKQSDKIDSAGDNLGMKLDIQADQLNQTKVLPQQQH